MAKDKKPSIYADRGTIGSSDELDEYGVWVKSEPQDLSQAFPEADGFSAETPNSDDIDTAIPDFEDLPDFDTLGLASPDSDALPNIPDMPEDDFGLPDLEPNGIITEEDNDSDVFNFGELTEPVELNSISLDSEGPDFGNLDSEDMDFMALSAEPEAIEPNAGNSSPEPDSGDDESFKEISMDEFIGTQDSADSLGSADSLESDEPIGTDSGIVSAIAETPVLAAEPESVELKAGSSQPVHSEEKETVKESQKLDLSTQLLMKIAEELSSIRSELSTLKKEFSGLRTVAAPKAESKEKDFLGEEEDEKISLTGDEMNNILNTADFTEEAGSDAAMGISDNEDDSDELNISTADLDMEIDLADTNLENLEGETKLGNSSLSDNADSAEPSGSLEISDSLEPSDSLGLSDSLESAEDSQIPSDMEIPNDSILDLGTGETDELNEIRENGVEPMTSAPLPEDTSYLTEDPLAENTDSGELPPELPEESADEGIDLSEAVIDEPDLSSEIHDNPLEEPSLEDISISLDISDLDSANLGSLNLDSPDSGSIEFDSTEDDAALPLSEDALQGEVDLSQPPENFVVEEDAFSEVLGKEESLEEIPLETIEEMPEETIEAITEETTIEDLRFVSDDSAPAIPKDAVVEEPPSQQEVSGIPANLKTELKTVLSYMDQLLEALPDEKIEEFAKSNYYDTYKKLFKELGLA